MALVDKQYGEKHEIDGYDDWEEVTIRLEENEYSHMKARAREMGKTLPQYVRDAALMQHTFDQRVQARIQRALQNRDMDENELGEVEKQIRKNEEKRRVEAEALLKLREEAEQEPDYESDDDYYFMMEQQGKLKQWQNPPLKLELRKQ